MSRLRLLVVAALLVIVGCEKKHGSDKRTGTEAPKPEDSPKPGVAPRSGKMDLRPKSTPQTAERPRNDLPPEANPPGVPAIDGTLEEDRGVRYVDEKIGTGPAPVKGKPIEVHYSGWLTDGKKFDASVDRGEPIKFNFDDGVVIKGWDIGLSSMKTGGKRRIIIPAELAYGDRDAGDIPPGSVLVFDVELISAGQ